MNRFGFVLCCVLLGISLVPAAAQPSGPGPVPDPWTVNGSALWPTGNGCITMPSNVTGGCKGNNTINAVGLYVDGNAMAAVTGAAPITSNIVSGLNTIGLDYDTNFTVNGSSALALNTISAGYLLANATSGAAEPDGVSWNSFANQAIGGTNGLLPYRSGGAWSTISTGTSGATIPLNNTANVFSAVQAINLTGGALAAAQTGTVLQAANASTVATRFEADAYGATGYFSAVAYGGTFASPAALSSGSEIGSFDAFGYNGSAIVGPRGTFRIYAAENWGGSANGTYADVAVTPPGTASQIEVAKFLATSASAVSETLGAASSITGALSLANSASANLLTLQSASIATAARTVTFPDPGGNDSVAYLAATQTLTNKTLASPDLTGTATLPDSSTLTSSGLGNLKALGVNESVPSTGNVNISGQYQVGGAQLAVGNLASISANTIVGQTAAGAPVALTINGGSSCTNALTWINGSGFGCNSSAGTGTVTSVGSGNGLVGGPITTSGTLSVEVVTPGGRLTLASNTPVMNATSCGGAACTGIQTLYYTSYLGGRFVPINNGTNTQLYPICAAGTAGACEVSISLGGSVNWQGGSAFDVFGYDNSGAVGLCTVQWTSLTARATALQQFNGLPTNAASATCRTTSSSTFTLAANQGTYLGSFATDAASSGQISFTFGGAASGGSAARLAVFNEFNRVNIATKVTDTGTAYSYGSTTIRQCRASAGMQIQFFLGASEDALAYSLNAYISPVTTDAIIGPGFDSVTAFGEQGAILLASGATSGGGQWLPSIGLHTFSCNQNAGGSSSFDAGSQDWFSVAVRL